MHIAFTCRMSCLFGMVLSTVPLSVLITYKVSDEYLLLLHVFILLVHMPYSVTTTYIWFFYTWWHCSLHECNYPLESINLWRDCKDHCVNLSRQYFPCMCLENFLIERVHWLINDRSEEVVYRFIWICQILVIKPITAKKIPKKQHAFLFLMTFTCIFTPL